MEGDNVEMSAGNGTPVSSRWNPTKEQISMLEGLYRQGIRTPSADQIQHITSRLKAFGHIEGKNVFYWFQNHKARQRQKQKQESMAYLNRFLHSPPPPPCANVVCSPYYLPRRDLGYYPQFPKVLLPGGGMRRRSPRTSEKVEKQTKSTCDGGYNMNNLQTSNNNISDQETLPLFPLHPTGILQGNYSSHHDHHAQETAHQNFTNTSPSTSSDNIDQPFFDFFSGQG